MRISKGFGLLELIVVLVVAGLLASLAIPAYTQFANNAGASLDDVVRANNGAYTGRAEDY